MPEPRPVTFLIFFLFFFFGGGGGGGKWFRDCLRILLLILTEFKRIN